MLDILGVTLILDALAGDWLLQAHQRFGVVSIAAVIRQFAVAVITVLVLTRNFAGLERYAFAFVAGTAIGTAITAFRAIRLSGAPVPTVSASKLYRRWRRSIPFAWAFVHDSDLLHERLVVPGVSEKHAGCWPIWRRVQVSPDRDWRDLAVDDGGVSLPDASCRRWQEGASARDVSRATGVAIVLAVALIALIVPVGRAFMVELFGVAYAPAAPAFIILMATASVVLVSVTLMNALLATGEERRYAFAVTVGAIANRVLNLALIPSFDATGAAIATLIAELIVCLYMVKRVRAVTGPLAFDRRRVGRGVAAAVIAGCALASMPSVLPAVGELVVGAAIFAGFALWLRAVTLADLRSVARLRKPA